MSPAEATASGPPLGAPPGPAAAPSWRTDPARRKLAWVILFRLVLDTVLLGGTAAWQARGAALPLANALYAIVLATFVASLVYGVWLASGRALRTLAWAQIATDCTMASWSAVTAARSDSRASSRSPVRRSCSAR